MTLRYFGDHPLAYENLTLTYDGMKFRVAKTAIECQYSQIAHREASKRAARKSCLMDEWRGNFRHFSMATVLGCVAKWSATYHMKTRYPSLAMIGGVSAFSLGAIPLYDYARNRLYKTAYIHEIEALKYETKITPAAFNIARNVSDVVHMGEGDCLVAQDTLDEYDAVTAEHQRSSDAFRSISAKVCRGTEYCLYGFDPMYENAEDALDAIERDQLPVFAHACDSIVGISS
jgi:hypothetical protein